MPRTDTYIEKDASINEQIDRMRHSATRALLERRDVVIVASVSCIYGIGSVETYSEMTIGIAAGERDRPRPAAAPPRRAAVPPQRRELHPRHLPRPRRRRRALPGALEDRAWRISFFGDEVESIHEFDPLTGEKGGALDADHRLPQQPLRHAEADAAPGGQADQGGAEDPARRVPGQRQAAGGAAAGAAHHLRHGDDGGDRPLRRDRELFALPHRPQAGRAAADPVRVPARGRAAVRRREPRHRAADRRHVSRRLQPQVDARRFRLPPAVLHRQPAAQVRGMGRDAAADRCSSPPPRASGRWSAPAACSSSR